MNYTGSQSICKLRDETSQMWMNLKPVPPEKSYNQPLITAHSKTSTYVAYRIQPGIRANQVISSNPLAATADWSEALRASLTLSTAAFAIFE